MSNTQTTNYLGRESYASQMRKLNERLQALNPTIEVFRTQFLFNSNRENCFRLRVNGTLVPNYFSELAEITHYLLAVGYGLNDDLIPYSLPKHKMHLQLTVTQDLVHQLLNSEDGVMHQCRLVQHLEWHKPTKQFQLMIANMDTNQWIRVDSLRHTTSSDHYYGLKVMYHDNIAIHSHYLYLREYDEMSLAYAIAKVLKDGIDQWYNFPELSLKL